MVGCVNGKIFVKRWDLNLKHMLEGGQSFRWKGIKENEWIGVFKGIVWNLNQSDDEVSFVAYPPSENSAVSDKPAKKSRKPRSGLKDKVVQDFEGPDSYAEILSRYLRTEAPLSEYYEDWSAKDANFKEAAVKFHGIRMLDQDPVENLFSFICSSNNNIARISGMVESLCRLYGDEICTLDSKTYHRFPDVERLCGAPVEEALRSAGFGYRAKFITSSAQRLKQLGGAEYLNSLKKLSYESAKEQLHQFPGVGPKVADCICLMSLGHFAAVPVDTHVFQVACQSYLPHLKSVKSVTSKVYNEIGDHFRQLYGSYAGWAHTILFCADLKKFQSSEKKLSRKAVKRKLKE